MSRRGARAAGFTLIELMAAVFLTTVVLSLAWAIFLNLSSGLETARERVRESRHALAILDRVARDLGGTYLLAKPPELDPLFHPWVFLAESHTESPGSDRVKFITRSHRPRNPLGHGSDLAVVTYVLEHADGGRYVLTRSLSPGLPEELDREFPTGDDHHTMVVAEGVASFGVRFLNDQQEWVDEWDSSLITESGELPLVAEIDLALAPPGDEEDDFGDLGSFDGDDLERFTRRVLLPMRPVSLELQMLAANATVSGAGDAEEENDEEKENDDDDDLFGSEGDKHATGMTVEDCLRNTGLLDMFLAELGPSLVAPYLGQSMSDPRMQALWAGLGCE